jgi:alpha-D-ribose 1-methylphosphonate 5-triphosphate diphosphatase
METLTVTGGRVLHDGAFVETDVLVEDGMISSLGGAALGRTLDGAGLLVLPGIIDIHGDAFERQLVPRPGVLVDAQVALRDTDRQLAANGITTAFHGVTWSWEPGLRGTPSVRALIDALCALRGTLDVDTRIHLRHEIYNLDAEAQIAEWIARGAIDCLAFNDHMEGTIKLRHRPAKIRVHIERSGLSDDEFMALTDRVHARKADVPGSVARLAALARGAGLPLLSHDDMSPAMRADYRALGCRIAEFPVNAQTAQAAAGAGDAIVFGAPNVMRGGSHTGCPSAAAMVREGLCTVLASDYYYPALPLAPFRLAAAGDAALAAAWPLVSQGPAQALGLTDRGALTPGLRADILLCEDRGAAPPRIVATLVAGRLVHLSEAARLR